MDTVRLQEIIIEALEDIKGHDIQVIDTSALTSLFDSIVVASAESARQTKALARNVQMKVKDAGGDVVSIEGEEVGEWILVDLGSVVVHIMQPAVRSFYNLEELWSVTPSGPRSLSAGTVSGRQ